MQQLWYLESTLTEVSYFAVVSSCLHIFSVSVNLPQDMFLLARTFFLIASAAITYTGKPTLKLTCQVTLINSSKLAVNFHKNIFLSRLEP